MKARTAPRNFCFICHPLQPTNRARNNRLSLPTAWKLFALAQSELLFWSQLGGTQTPSQREPKLSFTCKKRLHAFTPNLGQCPTACSTHAPLHPTTQILNFCARTGALAKVQFLQPASAFDGSGQLSQRARAVPFKAATFSVLDFHIFRPPSKRKREPRIEPLGLLSWVPLPKRAGNWTAIDKKPALSRILQHMGTSLGLAYKTLGRRKCPATIRDNIQSIKGTARASPMCNQWRGQRPRGRQAFLRHGHATSQRLTFFLARLNPGARANTCTPGPSEIFLLGFACHNGRDCKIARAPTWPRNTFKGNHCLALCIQIRYTSTNDQKTKPATPANANQTHEGKAVWKLANGSSAGVYPVKRQSHCCEI